MSPGSCGKFAWDAIDRTKRLFAAVRASGIPIVHRTRAVRPGVDQVQSTARPIQSRNKAPFDLLEDFAPLPGGLVLYKELARGFFGTPLGPYSRQMNVANLVVCGQSTSACVRSSAWEGYASGFPVPHADECKFNPGPMRPKIT